MHRRIRRKLRVARVENDDAIIVAPLGDHGVPGAGDRAAQHVEPRTEIANTRWSESADARGKRAHDSASARMSFNTPAAVTAGPAPGPVITSGFVWYRIVVNAT